MTLTTTHYLCNCFKHFFFVVVGFMAINIVSVQNWVLKNQFHKKRVEDRFMRVSVENGVCFVLATLVKTFIYYFFVFFSLTKSILLFTLLALFIIYLLFCYCCWWWCRLILCIHCFTTSSFSFSFASLNHNSWSARETIAIHIVLTMSDTMIVKLSNVCYNI